MFPPQAAQESFAVLGSISPLFEMVKGYIVASAEQIPEDLLTYRPTPEVRTFGEILGHGNGGAMGRGHPPTGLGCPCFKMGRWPPKK